MTAAFLGLLFLQAVGALHVAPAHKPALCRLPVSRHATAKATAAPPPSLLLAAKAKAVPFMLFGKSSFELFGIQNLALLSWSLYLLLPRWRYTPPLALIAPVVHSLLYAKILMHMIVHPAPGIVVDFASLEGIMPGFTVPDGAFAGWLHYCTFDVRAGAELETVALPLLTAVAHPAASPNIPRSISGERSRWWDWPLSLMRRRCAYHTYCAVRGQLAWA